MEGRGCGGTPGLARAGEWRSPWELPASHLHGTIFGIMFKGLETTKQNQQVGSCVLWGGHQGRDHPSPVGQSLRGVRVQEWRVGAEGLENRIHGGGCVSQRTRSVDLGLGGCGAVNGKHEENQAFQEALNSVQKGQRRKDRKLQIGGGEAGYCAPEKVAGKPRGAGPEELAECSRKGLNTSGREPFYWQM